MAAGLVALWGLAGCTTHLDIYPRLEDLASRGEYEQAARLVEERADDYGDRNFVLWQLDRAVFWHYAGEYEKSNRAFEAAEVRMEELWTESISGNIAAFLSNDNTLPYVGEDFEQVTVNLYRAMNYARLGDLEAALVEARKLNNKLNFINDQYEEGDKNEYREDAFARMLAGMFYEAGRTRSDLNDAYISNRNAVGIYQKDFLPLYDAPVPRLLKANLVTTAEFMGPQELESATERFPAVDAPTLDEKARLGEIVFVHFAGRSPVKVEDSINAVMPDGNILRIAFPRYQRRSYLIHGGQIVVDGRVEGRLELGSPLGPIAVKNLQNRKGRIAAKAIARATTKYIANRAAQNAARQQSEELGLLAWIAGNVYTVASEQADLRSWRTLPGQINIGRVLLEPGEHEIRVEFTGGGAGVVSTLNLGKMTVRAGQTEWVTLHTQN